jgi:ribonucleoside-diphosphate reductase alpha chain
MVTPSSSIVETQFEDDDLGHDHASHSSPGQPVVRPAAMPQSADAPYCYECGVQMQRAGSCFACPFCGTTSGCS